MYKAWYIVVLNKGIATYVVPARTGGDLGRKSEDSATPQQGEHFSAPWEGSLGPRAAWEWQPRAGAESSVLLSDCCAGRPAGGAGRGVARKV